MNTPLKNILVSKILSLIYIVNYFSLDITVITLSAGHCIKTLICYLFITNKYSGTKIKLNFEWLLKI